MELPVKMRQEYLSRRKTDLEALKSDSPPFKVLGHQIRGNARSYGFESLESLALEMEEIDSNSSEKRIKDLINKFEEWIEREEAKLSQP